MVTRAKIKLALDAHCRATANLKALTYAPWVLSLAAVLSVRDRAPELTAEQWVHFGLFFASMPTLGHLARRAIGRQRDRAEKSLQSYLHERGGFDLFARLQEGSAAYRKLEMSSTLRQHVIHAARWRKDELEAIDRRRSVETSTARVG